jgi:3-hydroxyisobutyrate dehydrogenase-like beta-hydroxyacid dehydrogenase
MSIRTRKKNVGVLGLGIIGQRVVESLREHGFHVFVWNRTPRPVPNFVGSPAEVAELCDFVQIFVSDDDALLQMVQRMNRNLTPQHVVMAHCTVSPDTMRGAAEIVERRGAQFLDAPFTGSKNAAEKGELVYYVGGNEVALKQAQHVLEATSKEIIYMGNVGDATTIKVATNMITAASVQAAAEALALVSKSGLSVEKFAAAMRNNGSNSATLEMKLPMMLEGNFEPHFSVKHMLKDVVIATRLGRGFGIEFGATDASRHGLTEELRQGRGDADYSSLLRQYFPAGGPLQAGPQPTNGEDDQPRLAGIDEGKRAELEQGAEIAAVAAFKPPEAKPASEESPGISPTETETDTKVQSEVAGHTTSPVAEQPASLAEVSLPKDEGSETKKEPAPVATRSSSEEGISEKKSETTVLSFPKPEDEKESEEPRGLWGGFWRRHSNDWIRSSISRRG